MITGSKTVYRTQHHTVHIVYRQRTADARKFYIAIAVICGTRNVFLHTVATGYIYVLSHGCTYVLKHWHTGIAGIGGQVGIKHFGKAHDDFLSTAQSAEYDTWHTGKILPHVIDKYTGTRLCYSLCGEFFETFHLTAQLRHKFKPGIIIG